VLSYGQAARTFSTPQEAAQALIDAASKNDTDALLKLFGPAGRSIVVSGDPAEDKAGREDFTRMAHEKLVVEQPHANRAEIVVGNQAWPMPVPLVRRNGQWMFDSAAGKIEVLARRVGANELNAIDVCRGYVEAQMKYAEHDRARDGNLEYAQTIVGKTGKHEGLYGEGESDHLVPKSFADAAAVMLTAQGKKPQPYHGYFFHILKAQGPAAEGGAMDYVVKGEMIGGFALVAWPAEYGVSGVNTFIVNHHGVVYQKDLGPTTSVLARQMTRFDPGAGWKKITGE
ncbi:MAG: DUF2950 domain-containing protein, partial [Bryobacteraceae bacterium]